MDAEHRLLASTGLEVDEIDSGCCGMAGGFGFQPKNLEISRACGELVLLPAVREAEEETWIVSGGFSCREQIRQETGRRALHPAEILALSLEEASATRP
jgi:Fe-S oxidoreductase